MKNILLLLLLISSLGYAQTSGTGGVGVNYGAVNKDLVFFSTTNTVPTVAPINGIDTHVLLNGTKYVWDGTQWKLATTNVLTKPTANTIQSTVDGVASASQTIIGTNVLGLTGSNLTSTINGVASNVLNLSSIIPPTTNTLTSSGNTMTNTTDGVAGTAPIINSNANALTKAGGLVTNVNGITATTAISAGTITDLIGFNAAGVAVNQTATSLNTDRVEYTGNNTVPTGTPLAGIDTRVLLNGDRYDWNGSAWVLQTVSNDWKVLGNAGTVQATNFVGTTDNVGLSFRTNNTIQQTITNTGNVGIGTTTPTAKLDVFGNAVIGIQTLAADGGQSIGANILNVATPTKIATAVVTAPETALRLYRAGTSSIKYNTSADFQIGTYGAGISAQTNLKIRLGNGDTQIPDTDIMTLQGNGNVGIGTTAPTTKLTISGIAGNRPSGAHYEAFINGSTHPIFQNLNWSSDNISQNFDMYFNGSNWISSGNTNSYQIYKTGEQLRFLYATSTVAGSTITPQIGMVLNNSGNVGIGTTNPIRKLEVNNTMKFTNNSTDANDGVIGVAQFSAGLNIVGINTDAAGRKISLWGGIKQIENSNGNVFIGNTNFPGGIWNTTGSVGIGKTTIFATLDVARGTGFDGTAKFSGTNRDTHFNYSTNEDTYIRGGKPNSNVYLNDNGGNVGIGTTAPTTKLEVAGTIKVTAIVNYATTAAAIADATLLAGTFYTVTVGGAKQLYVK